MANLSYVIYYQVSKKFSCFLWISFNELYARIL